MNNFKSALENKTCINQNQIILVLIIMMNIDLAIFPPVNVLQPD